MKKNSKKIWLILIITIFIFLNINSECYADGFSLSDIINKGKEFISSGSENSSNIEVKSLSNSIYSILQFVAIAVALIMAAILGIKYITGSVEMQADIKKTLIPYIAGCLIAFGAFTIWKLVIIVLEGVNL